MLVLGQECKYFSILGLVFISISDSQEQFVSAKHYKNIFPLSWYKNRIMSDLSAVDNRICPCILSA